MSEVYNYSRSRQVQFSSIQQQIHSDIQVIEYLFKTMASESEVFQGLIQAFMKLQAETKHEAQQRKREAQMRIRQLQLLKKEAEEARLRTCSNCGRQPVPDPHKESRREDARASSNRDFRIERPETKPGQTLKNQNTRLKREIKFLQDTNKELKQKLYRKEENVQRLEDIIRNLEGRSSTQAREIDKERSMTKKLKMKVIQYDLQKGKNQFAFGTLKLDLARRGLEISQMPGGVMLSDVLFNQRKRSPSFKENLRRVGGREIDSERG